MDKIRHMAPHMLRCPTFVPKGPKMMPIDPKKTPKPEPIWAHAPGKVSYRPILIYIYIYIYIIYNGSLYIYVYIYIYLYMIY